jgi:L-alanine-DL-glutamate epimerase-like enolase superfamily enzyme
MKALLLKLSRNFNFKPSFIGGFKGTLEWIKLAEKYKIGWWITSALEKYGLNAMHNLLLCKTI